MKKCVPRSFRYFMKGCVRVQVEMFDDGHERAAQVGRTLFVSRAHELLLVGFDGRVRDDLRGVNFQHSAQTMTTFAGSVGRVEGEGTRLKRRNIDATVYAGHALGIEFLFTVNDGNEHRAVRQFQSGADGFGETFVDAGLNQQTINDGFNRVIAPFVEPYLFVKRKQFAINARPQEPIFGEFLKLLLKLALATAYDRRKNHHTLALRQRENILHDLL